MARLNAMSHPTSRRPKAIPLAVGICLAGILGTLPVASANNGCLYCANAPVGSQTGTVLTPPTAAIGCGSNQIHVTPQTTSTQAKGWVDSFSNFGCNSIHTHDYAYGFNGISWTSSVGRTVNVYAFWNVSWDVNVSLPGAPCTGYTVLNAETLVQLNLSAWDATTATGAGPATTQMVDLHITICASAPQSNSQTTTAFQVHLAFAAVLNDQYYFDTRLLVLTTTQITSTEGAGTADAQANVGSGRVATFSSLEIY